MTSCADTSFLFSFYGNDVNTHVAVQRMRSSSHALRLHEVNTFEFENAVRLRYFQGKLTLAEKDRMISDFERDVSAGRILLFPIELDKVMQNARELSAKHTETLGVRAYDILQVAAAKLLGATDFWSFDGKQRALAQAEGMTVGP